MGLGISMSRSEETPNKKNLPRFRSVLNIVIFMVKLSCRTLEFEVVGKRMTKSVLFFLYNLSLCAYSNLFKKGKSVPNTK